MPTRKQQFRTAYGLTKKVVIWLKNPQAWWLHSWNKVIFVSWGKIVKNLDTMLQSTDTTVAAKICTGCVVRKAGPSERLNKENVQFWTVMREKIVEVTLESKLNVTLDLPLYSSVSSFTLPTVHLDLGSGVENGS